MTTFAGLAQRAHKHLWHFGCVVICLSYLCIASPTRGGRLICWQAIMNCHRESECAYAYEQYTHACKPMFNGQKKKCPSHCISSLVQLNLTVNGPALEDCSCDRDETCRKTKRAIEPCIPRTSSMGCTAARIQCQKDSECRNAMNSYLRHCGKLFSGETCTNACRDVISYMREIPKAQSLETCVCDGIERTICEFMKQNMKRLCFERPSDEEEGSGPGDDEDKYGNDDECYTTPEDTVDTGCSLSAQSILTLVASILVLLQIL